MKFVHVCSPRRRSVHPLDTECSLRSQQCARAFVTPWSLPLSLARSPALSPSPIPTLWRWPFPTFWLLSGTASRRLRLCKMECRSYAGPYTGPTSRRVHLAQVLSFLAHLCSAWRRRRSYAGSYVTCLHLRLYCTTRPTCLHARPPSLSSLAVPPLGTGRCCTPVAQHHCRAQRKHHLQQDDLEPAVQQQERTCRWGAKGYVTLRRHGSPFIKPDGTLWCAWLPATLPLSPIPLAVVASLLSYSISSPFPPRCVSSCLLVLPQTLLTATRSRYSEIVHAALSSITRCSTSSTQPSFPLTCCM